MFLNTFHREHILLKLKVKKLLRKIRSKNLAAGVFFNLNLSINFSTVTFKWAKVFRIIFEFRILRVVFFRKSASKSALVRLLRVLIYFQLIYLLLKSIDYLNLKYLIICRLTTHIKVRCISIQAFGNFKLLPQHLFEYGYYLFVIIVCPSSVVHLSIVRPSINNVFKQHLLLNHLIEFHHTLQ